jgi:hypothetical protein
MRGAWTAIVLLAACATRQVVREVPVPGPVLPARVVLVPVPMDVLAAQDLWANPFPDRAAELCPPPAYGGSGEQAPTSPPDQALPDEEPPGTEHLP